MDLEPGVVVADRFRLVRPLGQGGMGAVWLAQHTQLDTPCAVKFIHEEAARSPELRARFEREAKAAAQLRSTHVVQILDHGVWEERPYIAMEFLEGEDLAKRLRRRRPLEPREVVGIASQVGRALAKAHGAGLVHRDLKPSNIFLSREDDREIAKVLDFGVAKVTAVSTAMDSDSDQTKTGAILGTPFYMSPEQARGNKDVDHRADLWALSIVVYQCITGKLPFRSDALGDLLVKIIVEPLPVPSQVATVPPGFDAWWKRAADRDLSQRFQNARELTESLALALDVTIPGTAEVGTSIGFPVPRDSLPSLAGVPLPVAAKQGPDEVVPLGTPPVPRAESPLNDTAGTTATPSPSTPDSVSPHLDAPELPVARRAPLFIGVAAGVLLLAGIGVVALRGGPVSQPDAALAAGSALAPGASSETPRAPATPADTPAPAVPIPSVTAASSTAVAPTSATPSGKAPATAAPRSSAAPSAKPPHGTKPRTDFGI